MWQTSRNISPIGDHIISGSRTAAFTASANSSTGATTFSPSGGTKTGSSADSTGCFSWAADAWDELLCRVVFGKKCCECRILCLAAGRREIHATPWIVLILLKQLLLLSVKCCRKCWIQSGIKSYFLSHAKFGVRTRCTNLIQISTKGPHNPTTDRRG